MENPVQYNHTELVTNITIRPILKWAGGKTQLLNRLLPKVPNHYETYIEPFVGGGALFFTLSPANAIIADINPELINLYNSVALDVDRVLENLIKYKNEQDTFYRIRSQDWRNMDQFDAAARMIYLNRTCFNGLYRVNRQGEFNVPFGNYKNPRIIDEDNLRHASTLLASTTILCSDYKDVLSTYAKKGDFIFLDPPYLPVSKYSDFKRYTKEQFHEEDHLDLAQEVKRLHEIGCHVVLTNSNHPVVHEEYKQYQLELFNTKRNISSSSNSRLGQDVIVTAKPVLTPDFQIVTSYIPSQTKKYPSTRFMGSKTKLLPALSSVVSQFETNTALDLFSGSGVVSYLLKALGKSVVSNDYMAMSSTFTKAMVENSETKLNSQEIDMIIGPAVFNDCFVQNTFSGLYFSDEENYFIDSVRSNIRQLGHPVKSAIAMSALIRACMKKRPRGIFTYTGHRYNDGRRDLNLSLKAHFINAVQAINGAVFSNGTSCKSIWKDAFEVRANQFDLVYMDPPYYSPHSDNEYVRRYHFVEGLARDWKGVEIQSNTLTKKFKSYPTPFSSRIGAQEAFSCLFKKFSDSIIIVSYSSNSLPTLDEMVSLLSMYKKSVEVLPIDHTYSFGNQAHRVGDNRNSVKEYIFVGY